MTSTVAAEVPVVTEGTSLLVSLTRMEGKLDNVLGKHEALAGSVDDHETRLRAIEAKSTVSPLGLWTVVLGSLTGFAALLTIYANLTA